MNNFWKLRPVSDGYQTEEIGKGDRITIVDSQKLTPEGAYTTFRTYDHYLVLNLSKHFDRLEETSALAGKQIILKRSQLGREIADKLSLFDEPELKIRLSIDLTVDPGDIYLAIEGLITPGEDAYQLGIDVVTTEMQRTNPKAKLNKFLAQASEVRRIKGNEYEEILMVDEKKEILEGLSSNFYAISKGTLFTADEGVLSGTTRDFVLKLADRLGIPVVLRPASLLELKYIDEAFITSTSRSILPIRSIDKQRVGPTTPGPITAKIIRAFKKDLKLMLEDLRTV